MPGRALGISGWLVAAVVAATYLMARYDVTIQERGPQDGVKPVVDERHTDIDADV